MTAGTNAPIKYINHNVTAHINATYPGQRYNALIPDTFDLQQRINLIIHATTEITDDSCDHEIYWVTLLKHHPLMMQHDDNDHVQVKLMEALPLLRLAGGSTLNMHVDERWMRVVQQMQGEDGALYYPVHGRPWCTGIVAGRWKEGYGGIPKTEHYMRPFNNGRLLGAIVNYHRVTKDDRWIDIGRGVVQGLCKHATWRDDYAFYDRILYNLGEVSSVDATIPNVAIGSNAGWVLMGLAQYHRFVGDDSAATLAKAITKYLRYHSTMFDEEGRFTGDLPHFHHHALPLLAMVETAIALDDHELLEFCKSSFEHAIDIGNTKIGFFPEFYGMDQVESSETCPLADMISIGLKLTMVGVADYWDDIDRWVRNMFAESQLLCPEDLKCYAHDHYISTIDERYQTIERVAERNYGAFSGWSSPNDWYWGDGFGITHCCTGNAARTLYYLWHYMLQHHDGVVKVNLLINRPSPQVDIHSHLPYRGQVDLHMKQACKRLSLRIPEWVDLNDVRVTNNGTSVPYRIDGRYITIDSIAADANLTVQFPIAETHCEVVIEKCRYSLTMRGSDVVNIYPRGKYMPIFQRSHYRTENTRWYEVERFVSQDTLDY